jgi:hypothetical protein
MLGQGGCPMLAGSHQDALQAHLHFRFCSDQPNSTTHLPTNNWPIAFRVASLSGNARGFYFHSAYNSIQERSAQRTSELCLNGGSADKPFDTASVVNSEVRHDRSI